MPGADPIAATTIASADDQDGDDRRAAPAAAAAAAAVAPAHEVRGRARALLVRAQRTAVVAARAISGGRHDPELAQAVVHRQPQVALGAIGEPLVGHPRPHGDRRVGGEVGDVRLGRVALERGERARGGRRSAARAR